jgi:hypothetical protein
LIKVKLIRNKPILSVERMLHKNYGRKGSVAKEKKKPLGVSFKVLSAKMN